MISFSLLNTGLDEERTLLSIKAQMSGLCITLSNIENLQNTTEDFYVVCQFVSKVVSKITEQSDTVLELICKEEEHKFNVVFVNKMAEQIKKLILNGQLVMGNYLALQRPSLAILYDKTNIKFIKLEIGKEGNQSVVIWKSDTLFYIEPFLMQLPHLKCYSHMLFYDLDHIGSLEHVLSNLCHLANIYGPVEPLSKIAGGNIKSVALASFTQRVTPLVCRPTTSEDDSGVYVQVKFDEILLKPKLHIPTTFIAFFFGELAKEVENAVNNRHIEPGDLVALVYPHFDCKKAAPINISFPSYIQVNLVVLKNQYSIKDVGTAICLSDINLTSTNFSSSEGSNDDIDYSPIEFFPLKNYFDDKTALKKIILKLKKYGGVTSLKHLSEDNLPPLKKGIILSYFLKLTKSYNTSSNDGPITIFLREISNDCLYGALFKVVLGKTFAKRFSLAIKNKTIVKGDIICFLNPVVWKNPTYISRVNSPTFIVEVGDCQQQRAVVFKCSISKEVCKGINLEATQSKLLKTKEIITVQNIVTNEKNNTHNEDVLNDSKQLPELISQIFLKTDQDKYSKGPHKTATAQNVKTTQAPMTTGRKNIVDDAHRTCLKENLLFKRPLSEDNNLQDKHKKIKQSDDSLFNKEEPRYKSENELEKSAPFPAAHPSCTVPIEEDQQLCYALTRNKDYFDNSKKIIRSTVQHDRTSSKDEKHKMNNCTLKGLESLEKCNTLEVSTNQFVAKLNETDQNILNIYEDIYALNSPCAINPSSIPKECLFTSNRIEAQVNDKFSEYAQKFPLLPLLLTKPSLKHFIDLVSGYCNSGCKQMYPYSTTLRNLKDLLKPLCPRCSKVLQLNFCLEMIAVGLNKLVTVLLHGAEAESYLNISCEQFLDYDNNGRKLIVKQLEKTLEKNRRTGKGETIQTTNVTYWQYR